MYGYIFFIVVASTVASNVYANCPDVIAVDNFNLNAYGNGVWFEVGRYSNQAEKGGNCGSAEYKLEGDIINVKNSHVTKNQLRSITGFAQLADDAGTTGKLVFSLPYGASGAITKNVLSVLATDYSNYAVAYYCKYNEDKKITQDFAWVLSRSKTLEGDTKATVEKFLKESTLLDSSKLIWLDFSDEACKVEA